VAARRHVLTADDVSTRLEQAHYELATESRLARVGLKARLEMAPILQRYAHLFRRDQIDAVRVEADAASGECREELVRIYYALLDGFVDARAADLHDEAATSLSTTTITVDGAAVPFHAVVPEIARSADPERRERLMDGYAGAVAARNDLLSRLQATTDDAVIKLGFESYLAFYEAMKGIDYRALAPVVEALLERTEPLYQGHVAPWVQAQIGSSLDGLSCAHTYWLRRNGVPAELFPADKMTDVLGRSLRAFGVDLASQSGIHIDADDRPTKNPRACVFGARVPGEVHLVVKPTGGKLDYDAMFHEAGHAEHYACTDPALPYAFRRLSRSMAQQELFSYLMENLVDDPEWLQTYLGLTAGQAALVTYRSALNDLILLRRYCAKFLYELELFGRGGDGPSLYAGLLRRHTGFAYPPDLYQHDRDPGFYSADYLRAWIGHAQVRAGLRRQFGPRWWADPAAGALVRGLWAAGVRPEIEDVVRSLGGVPGDISALLDYVRERLDGGRSP
jgi:hypothetical protein